MPYIIAILVIAVLGVGFTLFQSKDASEAPAAVTTTETPATKETIAYRDGTYTAKTSYQTPKRDEYVMDVTLTFAGNVVTDASVAYSQGAEKDPNAQKFEAAYKAEVVGKKIDSINLSRVGGASLTTTAFNNALTNIKIEARS
ncbi:MAG: hypothetical protein RL538_396 [Candidatus Parcubacteria bacterium]|jgi:uncharacterized protein with FMN-binding domain